LEEDGTDLPSSPPSCSESIFFSNLDLLIFEIITDELNDIFEI